MTDLTGQTVVVTGATGAAGRATVEALLARGAHVVAVGRDGGRLAAALGDPGDSRQTARRLWFATGDLTQPATSEVVAATARELGGTHGVVHLVGGWRGADRLTGLEPEDVTWLVEQIVLTTAYLSLAFHADLVANDGRFVIVSSTSVANPTGGNAAYAAAKAAAETWLRAAAEDYRRAGRGAAVTLVVGVLSDQGEEGPAPAGTTDVRSVARAVIDLWDEEPAFVNGARIEVRS